MIPYKNRILITTKSVLIYRNLTKGKTWVSIKQAGLVIGHSQNITLKDCTAICNLNVRDYSVKIKRKLVHTFIKGFISDDVECTEDLKFSMISPTGFTISNIIFTKSDYVNFNNGILKTK